MYHFVSLNNGEEVPYMVNKNVNWVGKRFYVFYVSGICVGAYASKILFVDKGYLTDYQGWTLVHVIHGFLNFYVMHYLTGAPAELDNDEFHDFTWWEQLDNGEPWSTKKRNLMLICIILFLVVSHVTDYDFNYLVINTLVLSLVIVPKMPQFYRVRLSTEPNEGQKNANNEGSKPHSE